MKRRISLHLAFWLAYLLITGYIESVMVGSSFSGWPLLAKLRLGYSVELLGLPIKMAAVYWFLYRLLPRHLEGRSVFSTALEGTIVMIAAALLFRWQISAIIFPYLYGEAYPESRDVYYQLSRYLWAFLDIFYVVGIASAIKMYRLRMQALEREKQLMQEKWQSELNFLRAQANPHFLFNTLNNIYGLARRQSPKTADVVMKLSKLLRYMLYECSAGTVPISKEMKVIESYVELEQIRYGERLQLSTEMAVDDENRPLAPLLLLPLVENAFKHGSSESRFNCRISLQLRLKNGALKLKVANTFDEETSRENGIGLQNLERQLELLYPGRYQLETGPQDGQYIAELNIELP